MARRDASGRAVRKRVAWLALGAGLAALLATGATAQLAAAGGSFTSAQTEQGKALFMANCAVCHDASLTGSSHGPALTGQPFAEKWRARSSDDLFTYIKTMMPPGSPGLLTDREAVAVTGFLLARNGHVAGDRPLAVGAPVGVVALTGLAEPARPGPADPTPVIGASAKGNSAEELAFARLVAAMAVRNRRIAEFAPVTEAMLASPPPGDWLNWRRTRDGHGESPLDQIDAGNVARLRLEWVMALPDGTNEPTPIVHDGVMYILAPGGQVLALDAASGDFIWKYRYERPDGGPVALGPVRNLSIFGTSL